MKTKEELEKIVDQIHPGLALLSPHYELIYHAATVIYNLAIDDAADALVDSELVNSHVGGLVVDKNSILKLKIS